MRPAFRNLWPDERPDLLKRRSVGIAAAILVHLLAFLLAYLMSPPLGVKKPDDELKSFSLIKIFDRKIAPKPQPQGRKAPVKEKATGKITPPKSEIVSPPTSPLKMMIVSSDVFASSDISKMQSHSTEAAGGNPAGDSDSGVGEGPGGAPLYNAEWYREPTDAEFNFYMPKTNPRSGVGMIICKTIPDYRVEDCRELGESPPGVGIARAMREAAWQFRIRPPRIGGKPLIGAWVRIRYDVTVGFIKK